MIKYVIFDLGGVIVESGATSAYDKIGSLLNLTKEQVREYLAESSLTGEAYRKSEISKEIHANVAKSLGMKVLVYKDASKLVSDFQCLGVRI